MLPFLMNVPRRPPRPSVPRPSPSTMPGTVEPNPFLAGAGLEDEDLGPEAPPPPPGRAAQDGLAHSMRPTSLAGSGCRLMVRLC